MTLLAPLLFLAVGLGAGALHFALLRRNVELFGRGGSILAALGLRFGRMAVNGAVLVLAALDDWPSLLACALGVLLVRQAMVRRGGGAAP